MWTMTTTSTTDDSKKRRRTWKNEGWPRRITWSCATVFDSFMASEVVAVVVRWRNACCCVTWTELCRFVRLFVLWASKEIWQQICHRHTHTHAKKGMIRFPFCNCWPFSKSVWSEMEWNIIAKTSFAAAGRVDEVEQKGSPNKGNFIMERQSKDFGDFEICPWMAVAFSNNNHKTKKKESKMHNARAAKPQV